mgnify:CR=1 FL=1
MSHPTYNKFVGRFGSHSAFINLDIKDDDDTNDAVFLCRYKHV